jgi:hypothetical protein
MPPSPSLSIDRLIGGNRVQPGAERAARFELLTLQMHLEEGRLERISAISASPKTP